MVSNYYNSHQRCHRPSSNQSYVLSTNTHDLHLPISLLPVPAPSNSTLFFSMACRLCRLSSNPIPQKPLRLRTNYTFLRTSTIAATRHDLFPPTQTHPRCARTAGSSLAVILLSSSATQPSNHHPNGKLSAIPFRDGPPMPTKEKLISKIPISKTTTSIAHSNIS